MLIYVILVLTFITFFLIFSFIFSNLNKNKRIVHNRLKKISKQSSKNVDDELSESLSKRILSPILDDISRVILKITPKEMVSSFEKKVTVAGKPYNFSVKNWINIQAIAVVGLPLITIIVSYYRGLEARKIFFFCIVEVVLGLVLPNLILSKKAADRKKKITNSLPDVIDLLTVSVEAGLGFDGALSKVVDKVPGPLADEFESVLQEIKVGKSKREAMRDMAERACVPDLTTFVSSVIQADQFGVSIGNVLRIQSEQLRQKRRQRAQEKAMKAPVKMLIPMVLFIFPTIFSVLIGPIIIKVVNTLMK